MAAAPTTRKQVSATIVMALVKNVSIPADWIASQNWMPIKALPCRRWGSTAEKRGNRTETAKNQAATARS